MKPQDFKLSYANIGLMIIATILILIIINFKYVFHTITDIFNAFLPFIIGGIMAYILHIIVKYYERVLPHHTPRQRKISRVIAVISTLLTILIIIGLICFLVIPQFIHSLSILIHALPTVYQNTSIKINEYLTLLPPNYQHIISENINNTLNNFNAKAIGNMIFTNILYSIQSLVSIIIKLVIGFIFSLFILGNQNVLEQQFNKLFMAYLSHKKNKKLHYFFKIVNETFHNYIVGQCLDAAILGAMVTFGLFICGVKYPISIGCVIGLLALIPLLGAYMGGLMGVIMLLPLGISQPIIFLIVLFISQQIESNIIYPRVVGGSIGLPGIWTFMSITLGGTLAGITGIILSVPLSAIAYKLLKTEVEHRLHHKK